MSGLILKLRPFEELLINGVLVENGDRNTRLRVKTEGAHILRLKDALKPEEATTPFKRAYYAAQQAVAGLISNAEATDLLKKEMREISDFAEIDTLIESVARHDFYRVMRCLRDEALSDRAAEPRKIAGAR